MTGQSTNSAAGRYPFIEFPLWGLEVALSEHKKVCAACSGDLTADCARVRYSDMLRDKIESARPAGCSPARYMRWFTYGEIACQHVASEHADDCPVPKGGYGCSDTCRGDDDD